MMSKKSRVRATSPRVAIQDQIWLRDLADLEPEPVDGAEGGANPFFSKDGEWLGFFANERRQKVPVSGGAPVTFLYNALA